MRQNDTQSGLPETLYKDTKTSIEALGSPIEGMKAYATDTHLEGYYNGTAWSWSISLDAANVFTALQTMSISDAATNTIVNPLAVTHNSSSGSIVATFGVRQYHNLKSTTTADTNAASIETQWVVATHASRTARTTFNSIDFGGVRELMRIEGSGTAGLLSFFGLTAVVRATAYTQTYNTASKTVPAITSLAAPAGGTGTSAGGYDTASNRNLMITSQNAIRTDLTSLYKVVTQIIDDLQAYGLLQ